MYFLCEKDDVTEVASCFCGELKLDKNDEVIQSSLCPDVVNDFPVRKT